MNGTWVAFCTLLLVVLVAVALGAQQMETEFTQEMAGLMQQRDTVMSVAQEAKDQRNVAYDAQHAAQVEAAEYKAKVAVLEGDLQGALAKSQDRQTQINSLTAQLSEMQAQYTVLETEYTSLKQRPQIPVVGGSEDVITNSEANENAICLQVQSDELPAQLGLGLAILIGMAALGSGGYIYHRHDPSRKYTVKMTKDQIRDYARYQREWGNRIG